MRPLTDLALAQHRRPEPWRLRNCLLLIGTVSAGLWLAIYAACNAFLGG